MFSHVTLYSPFPVEMLWSGTLYIGGRGPSERYLSVGHSVGDACSSLTQALPGNYCIGRAWPNCSKATPQLQSSWSSQAQYHPVGQITLALALTTDQALTSLPHSQRALTTLALTSPILTERLTRMSLKQERVWFLSFLEVWRLLSVASC